MSTIALHSRSRSAPKHLSAAPGIQASEEATIAERVRSAGSSFAMAMRLLPPSRRKAMYALYAFCREVDDITDGEASRSLKLTLLGEWRSEIARLFAGRPQHIVTRALFEPVCRYDLRCGDFLAIIDGMEMDARTDIRAPSLSELDLYCSRVAVAVGLISVRIFGDATPAGETVAKELGRALQITNILRDLAEDGRRGRLYLPRPVLQAHGIFATVPSAVLAHPALSYACNDMAERAEAHFVAAAKSIAACPRSAMRPAATMLAVYRAVLRALRARGWDRLREPIRIPTWHKVALLLGHGLTGR
jgi:phytoene synthase